MDAKAQWKVSSKVETLVDAINDCRLGLVGCVKERNPFNRHMKTASCDAYASPKVIELLHLSQLWRPAVEKSGDDEGARKQSRKVSELVADFDLFKLHRDDLIGDAAVRLVMTFEVGGGATETFYGNVELLS